MKKFVFVGGGGHCQSCINSAELAGFNVVGIVDNQVGAKVLSYEVIGNDSDLPDLAKVDDINFIVTVGMVTSNSLRAKIYKKLIDINANRASLIAKTAVISKHAVIGKASVILEQAVINAKAIVGENVIINTAAIIEHGATIGNHTHISTRAVVNGDVSIGQNCMIGSGSVILQGITIADNVTIGAGAIVIKDILEAGTWVGSPARKLNNDLGE